MVPVLIGAWMPEAHAGGRTEYHIGVLPKKKPMVPASSAYQGCERSVTSGLGVLVIQYQFSISGYGRVGVEA